MLIGLQLIYRKVFYASDWINGLKEFKDNQVTRNRGHGHKLKFQSRIYFLF